MKKLFLAVLLFLSAGITCAESDVVSYIGPGLSSTYGTSNTVTLASPGVRQMNCLTDLSATAMASHYVSILEGGTTVYQVLNASGTLTNKVWDNGNEFCISPNSIMYVTIRSTFTTASFQSLISYRGVVKDK